MTDFEKVAAGLVTLASETPGRAMRHHFEHGYKGLKVVVKRDGDLWTLGIWYPNKYPDTPEIDATRQAFDIPQGSVAFPKAQKIGNATWKGFVWSWHGPAVPVAQARPVGRFVAR